MRTFKTLIVIVSLLSLSAFANAQTTVQDTVCVGATASSYWVTKTPTSTYSWTLTGGGTIISGQGTDSVSIDWASTVGTDTLKVIETNALSCVGDPIVLAITRVAAPIADAGSDQTIGNCATSTAQLNGNGSTGSGTLTYAWSPATGLSNANIINPVANPTVSTTYTLTVSSSFGCSDVDDVVITVAPAPVAIASADDTIGSCVGQSASISASSSTGTSLRYAWTSTPAGFTSTAASASVSPSVTTTYNLTVTDDYGCTSTDQQIIVVEAAPVASATTTKDTIGSCALQSTIVDASASTGLGLGYSWTSSPAGFTSAIANPTVSPTVTTTYTVVITDRFGCTSNANLTITVDALPVAKAGSDQTICSGNNTSIDGSTSTGSDLSYSWASSPAGFTSAVANPSVSPTVTTTYTLTTTDKHGCTANDDVVITVNAGAIASITVNPSICEGEKILLTGTATNGSSFLWSTAGDGGFNNTSTINPEYTPGSNDISSGSVNITITVQGNAPCPAASDSKTITINPKPNTSSIFHF